MTVTRAIPLWRLTTLRRRLFEAFGSARFSRPACYDIERKLLARFDGPGYFVEAGAVDGVFESNTYFLERFRGWSGLLIEPSPEMFRRIAVNRPRARAVNCALVSFDYDRPTVTLTQAHAMTRVSAEGAPVGVPEQRVQQAAQIEVPARTLQSVLEGAGVTRIDLLSLDVEGYEREVLRGLNLDIFQPRYVLAECFDSAKRIAVEETLGERYRCVEQLSPRDFLWSRT